MAAAFALESLGLSKDLLTAGAAALGAALAAISVDRVKNLFKSRGVSKSLDYHCLHEKHKFSEECGVLCMMQAHDNIYEVVKLKLLEGTPPIPYVVVRGKCKHDCTIEFRMSVPPHKKEWEISTVCHVPKGFCKAKLK